MYLDLLKDPTIVMLGKRTFIINDVGDDDMDVSRLNWSTSALAVIGVHCNPASRRPPMHFLLHKALESSAILCTVPQIHLYFRMHSKKASHRTWSWGWGQGCEKRILSRNKMSITHPYQNCSWFIVTTSRQWETPHGIVFQPRNDREKKRNHYISHLWAKYGRSFTEESLADRFSCKALPQLQLPQVAFFRILSCWCARPFPPKCSLISSGLLCPEMKGSLFGFQRSGASRRTCEFSLWKGKVFPHPGIFSFKIREIEWKVFLTLFAPAYLSVSKDQGGRICPRVRFGLWFQIFL